MGKGKAINCTEAVIVLKHLLEKFEAKSRALYGDTSVDFDVWLNRYEAYLEGNPDLDQVNVADVLLSINAYR